MRYDCSEMSTAGSKLKCPMSGCNAELTEETKDDLLKQGMEQAKTHGMAALSPDMMSKLRNAIKPA
jgi:predicted small metal-binding protein